MSLYKLFKEKRTLETSLPTILPQYELMDIYNAEGFGLFYQALRDKSLHDKGERLSGGKHSKVRLTGLATGNAIGEKFFMFVTGKPVKRRCFSVVKNFPCRYRAEKHSWMDEDLFTKWVKGVKRNCASQDRKIALIIHDCLAHLS